MNFLFNKTGSGIFPALTLLVTATMTTARPFSVSGVPKTPLKGALPLDINLWSAHHVLTYVDSNLKLPHIMRRMRQKVHTESFEEVDGSLLLRDGLGATLARFGFSAKDQAYAATMYRWNFDKTRSQEWDLGMLLDNANAKLADSDNDESMLVSTKNLLDRITGSCTALFAGDSLGLPVHWSVRFEFEATWFNFTCL